MVQMALSTAPLFFSFLLQSSGLPTMLTIAREKNTGERSAMPYVAMLANCCVWTVYGALRADATCMLVNGLGAVFGSLYTLTFALHTQQPMRAYFALLVALVGGVSAAALLFEQVRSLHLHNKNTGWTGFCDHRTARLSVGRTYTG
jgi:uncharacterized protein with PQ loop repeat